MASQYVTTSAVAKSIPFNNETNGFITSDVQEAIEEAGAGSFSWNFIPAGYNVMVKLYRQMVSYQEIEVGLTGELTILGEVVIVE